MIKALEFVLMHMHATLLNQTLTKFRKRHENVYVIYIEEIEVNNESCLIANDVNDSWLWHRKLGHASMKTLSKLVKND